jgi:hypothetical protein
MSKILTPIGIICLLIIAVVLGYTIFQKQIAPSSNNQAVTNQQYITPQPSTNNSTTTAPTTNQPSAEEQDLVKAIPGSSSTLEERVAYNIKLQKFEKVTDTIEITNCWPNPFIARVREFTDLKIKNNDNVEQLIYLGQTQINVPAGKTITTKPPGKGDGITNLTCNGGAQGLLHVIQVQ